MTASYPAAQTPTPTRGPAGFTTRHLRNLLRHNLNLLRFTMPHLTNRLRENLNLPGPVLLRYAELKTLHPYGDLPCTAVSSEDNYLQPPKAPNTAP